MSKPDPLKGIRLVSGRAVVVSGIRECQHNTKLLVLLMAIALIATAFSWEAAGNPKADKADSTYRRSTTQGLAQDPEFAHLSQQSDMAASGDRGGGDQRITEKWGLRN